MTRATGDTQFTRLVHSKPVHVKLLCGHVPECTVGTLMFCYFLLESSNNPGQKTQRTLQRIPPNPPNIGTPPRSSAIQVEIERISRVWPARSAKREGDSSRVWGSKREARGDSSRVWSIYSFETALNAAALILPLETALSSLSLGMVEALS